jgi:uroporphyrin-III C-methyltransferase
LAASARDAHLTLVIYMGVAGAQQLQDGLLGGLPARTPVAVVQDASLPTQRGCVTELGRLASTLASEHIESPAIIVVGEVARAAVLAGAMADQDGAAAAVLASA